MKKRVIGEYKKDPVRMLRALFLVSGFRAPELNFINMHEDPIYRPGGYVFPINMFSDTFEEMPAYEKLQKVMDKCDGTYMFVAGLSRNDDIRVVISSIMGCEPQIEIISMDDRKPIHNKKMQQEKIWSDWYQVL